MGTNLHESSLIFSPTLDISSAVFSYVFVCGAHEWGAQGGQHPKRSIGSSELESQVVLSHQACAGNSTLVLEGSKCSWWLSLSSFCPLFWGQCRWAEKSRIAYTFLPLNATLHRLLVSSLSVEKSVTNSCFCSFWWPCAVLIGLLFSIQCAPRLGTCAPMALSELYPHSGVRQLWALLGQHSFSPLCPWDSGDTHTRPLRACLCFLNTSAFLSRPTWVLSTRLTLQFMNTPLCCVWPAAKPAYRLYISVIMLFIYSTSSDYFPKMSVLWWNSSYLYVLTWLNQ